MKKTKKSIVRPSEVKFLIYAIDMALRNTKCSDLRKHLTKSKKQVINKL